jgi:uncharacterized membrane protein YtjA (UPF0391 family)
VRLSPSEAASPRTCPDARKSAFQGIVFFIEWWNKRHPVTFFGDIGRRHIMLYWALVFLVVAIIAGALGFGGIAGTSAGIAQILFFIFLAFLVISLIAGLFRRA